MSHRSLSWVAGAIMLVASLAVGCQMGQPFKSGMPFKSGLSSKGGCKDCQSSDYDAYAETMSEEQSGSDYRSPAKRTYPTYGSSGSRPMGSGSR